MEYSLFNFYHFRDAASIVSSQLRASLPVDARKAFKPPKHALRWGIENGELSQKLEDIYTYHFSRHDWDVTLPKLSQDFLNELEPTRPGSYRSHRNAHKVFHTFLAEKNLTYRKLRIEHIASFIKYLSQKDFSLHTRVTISWQVRSYLRRLHRMKKIKRHPDEIFPPHLVPKDKVHLPRPLAPDIDRSLQQILENTDDIYTRVFCCSDELALGSQN